MAARDAVPRRSARARARDARGALGRARAQRPGDGRVDDHRRRPRPPRASRRRAGGSHLLSGERRLSEDAGRAARARTLPRRDRSRRRSVGGGGQRVVRAPLLRPVASTGSSLRPANSTRSASASASSVSTPKWSGSWATCAAGAPLRAAADLLSRALAVPVGADSAWWRARAATRPRSRRRCARAVRDLDRDVRCSTSPW